MTQGTKIGLITFAVFMTEAIIHYNVGVNKDKVQKKFILPPTKDFVKLAVVVGIFSIINKAAINKLAM